MHGDGNATSAGMREFGRPIEGHRGVCPDTNIEKRSRLKRVSLDNMLNYA